MAEISKSEPGRRTSARVSARIKSTPQSASKRKRNGNPESDKGGQSGQSSQEEDISESEDEQDEEEEEEAQGRTRKIRKSQMRPPSKRVKTKGDLVHLTIRTAPKNLGKARKSKPIKIVEAAKTMGGLYGSLIAMPCDSISVILIFLQRRFSEKVDRMIRSFQIGYIDLKSMNQMLSLNL